MGKSADAREKSESTETKEEGERPEHGERIGALEEEGRNTIRKWENEQMKKLRKKVMCRERGKSGGMMEMGKSIGNGKTCSYFQALFISTSEMRKAM